PADCGYSAYYDARGNNGKIEIIFSQVTAEILGGKLNCGFGYVPTNVTRAEIDGTALPERIEADKFQRNSYHYAAPAGFDPRKSVITIFIKDKRYVSDPTFIKQTDNNVNIPLKPIN
ncbi:MAG: hypothetical protein ABI539_10100, partial [Acidobacteriota bacterium]